MRIVAWPIGTSRKWRETVRNLFLFFLHVLAGVMFQAGNAEADTPVLRFLESHPIHNKEAEFREPSALAANPYAGGFWSLSDDGQRLFRLDASGAVSVEPIAFDGLDDPEGIAFDSGRGRLLALSEADATIFAVPLEAPESMTRHALLGMDNVDLLLSALDGEPDRLSPEGITFDSGEGSIYVVNERRPRVLIRISPDLSTILSVETLTAAKGFRSDETRDHHLDVSGLAHDPLRRALWIASDTGKCVFFRAFVEETAARIDLVWREDGETRQVHNAEGIALGLFGDQLFVVTDDGKNSRLLVYAIE